MRSKQGGIKAWLIFILIVVIAFGALYYFRSIAPFTTDSTEISEDEKTPKKKFALSEVSEEKMKEVDSKAMESALEGGNIEDCEKITYDEALKQKCLDSLSYAAILRSGDESECEKLYSEDLKNQCLDKIYYSDAMDTMDTDLCKKISDENLMQRCLDQIQVFIGKEADTAEGCDEISNSVLKQECLNNFYYSSSIKDLNEESCDNITNSQLRERCSSTITQNKEVIALSKMEVASVPTTTKEVLEGCDNYQDERVISCKDDANYELAFEEKDISYCSRIYDTAKQIECIEKQGDNINQFYFRQGTAYGDATMCQKITNTALEALCLDSI